MKAARDLQIWRLLMRALATAGVIGALVTLNSAQAQGVRAEIGKPLQQAGELLRAGKAKEALADRKSVV